MKRFSAILPLFLFAAASCSVGKVDPYSKVAGRVGDPVEIDKADISEWKLANGLQIKFVENNEFPLVEGALYIRGGSLWEEPKQQGLTGAMGEQMRLGGAGKLSADVLDEKLEYLSASVGSSFSGEYGSVSFSCLDSDLEAVFAMFADVVQRPVFQPDRLELWKGQAVEGIRRRKDDPDTVGAIALKQLLFGNTPYGRVTVESDVAAISTNLMRERHAKLVRPQGAVLAVTGRIKREKLEELVTKYFGSWAQEGNTVSLIPPAVDFTPSPGIYFINQPLEQATIYMGQQGVKRLSPDYLAIDAFNQIFGAGDFSALLTRKIRSELGLAYGVFGAIVPGVVRGKNFIGLQTKSEATGEAILESLLVLKDMQASPVESGELKDTIKAISKSYVFNFDSLGKVLNRKVQFEILGFPDDFDETYLPGIKALEPADIQEVAKRRWDIKNLIIVVVGNDTAWHSLKKMLEENQRVDPKGPFENYQIRQIEFNQKLDDLK